MSSATMPFGALTSIGFHSGEKFRIYPTLLSVITTRYPAAVPYTPQRAPKLDEGSTISGFELEEPGRNDQSLSSSTYHTPSSSGASQCSNLNANCISPTEIQVYLQAMETRIEQLMEENEILAEELRRIERKRKQKKQKKRQEKKEKVQTDILREVLRATTAVLTPLPQGSPARFVLMAVETLFLRERVVRA